MIDNLALVEEEWMYNSGGSDVQTSNLKRDGTDLGLARLM